MQLFLFGCRHNDLAIQYRMRVQNHLRQVDLRQNLTLAWPGSYTDIPRLKAGMVGAQVSLIDDDCSSPEYEAISPELHLGRNSFVFRARIVVTVTLELKKVNYPSHHFVKCQIYDLLFRRRWYRPNFITFWGRCQLKTSFFIKYCIKDRLIGPLIT